jgi:hypothetical protein
MQSHRRARRPALEQLDDRCLLSGLTPVQLTHAYGLDAITFTSPSGATIPGNGAGETIALIEAYHDPSLISDLLTFDQTYNLPRTTPTVITLGGARTNDGWALEESLDVEWAHAIAPGANLVVVEASSQGRQSLMAAVDAARRIPSVTVVSMSWGFSEVRYESSTHFTTPGGHPGITFVAASGDNGLAGGTNWPAVEPNVLSVGGTSLNVGHSGTYLSETAWYDSGGGLSRFAAEPSYERMIQTSGKRSTPDVAFVGDPDTGVEVYQTTPGTFQGSWQVVGGTSLGTPAWAAIIAIADQGRSLEGKGSLDGATQTLPALYSLPATDFHTIAPASAHELAGGANLATGLGSPVGSSLIPDLVASNVWVPLSISSATGSGAGSAALHPRSRRPKHARLTHAHAAFGRPAGHGQLALGARTAIGKHFAAIMTGGVDTLRRR